MKRAAISFGILSFLLFTFDPFRLLPLVLSDSKNATVTVDLDTWEAPQKMQKLIPYFISGLDNQGVPIVMAEMGKWDIRKYFEDGGDYTIADLYLDQLVHCMQKAESRFSNGSNATGRFAIIGDWDGINVRQLTHGPTLYVLLSLTKKVLRGPIKHMEYYIGLNAHPVVETFFNNMINPIIGEYSKKLKIFGTNSETWIPYLLEKIPKESLAFWYGGSPGPFRPLAVFG